MKCLIISRRFQWLWLLLSGFLLPAICQAQAPISISGDVNVCVGEITTYTPGVSNAGYSYTWSITPSSAGVVLSGNSTGANIQWSTPGSATVHLSVTDPANGNSPVYAGSLGVTVHTLPAPYITTNVLLGCQQLNTDSMKGESPPTPQFDSSHCELVCANSTVIYTANGNSGSTFTWSAPGAVSVNPGGGGLTCAVTWGGPGYGQVSVTETTSAGCQASSSFCVQIVESPVALFKPIPDPGDPIIVCLHGELVLQDFSTGSAAAPIVSWLWDWGDGAQTTSSPGTVGNPVSHQYDQPGNYNVTLIVTNACGCSGKFTRKVKVIKPQAPVIACPRIVCEKEETTYTVDQPCSPDSWQVVGGHITGADASKVQVVWDDVDPNTGFGFVSYKSCDPCEMIVTEKVPVLLRKANIQGPQVICLGQQTVYRLPKWPATEFNWVISGPAIIQPTDQRNEIAVTATGPGTITLSLKYYNTVLPCEGNAKLSIQVLAPATIYGDTAVCQGGNLSFNLGGPSGNWTLRNPANAVVATGSGPTFGHTFTGPGIYRLSVNGTTFCPPPDKLITVVGTPPPPDAILGPDRACAGIPVHYDAGNPVPGTTFLWSTSGGGIVNADIGDHSEISFAAVPNNVVVRRVTTDGLHCQSAPLSKFVDVPVPPLSISGPATVCHSTQNVYHVNYTDGDQYEWTFSNSNLGSVVANGNSPDPTILFNVPPNNPGQPVTLQVRVWKCGVNTYTASYNVYVKGTPDITSITASSTTVCSGTGVTLTVSTDYPVSTATSTTWQWGDGPGATSPGYPASGTFSHTYITDGATSPAVFTPAITINDPNGCPGTVTAAGPAITVLPRPVAIVSPTGPIQKCGPFSVKLYATETTGLGGTNTFNWSPSGSGTVKTVTSYGVYFVTVHNSLYGCENTSNHVIVEPCDTSGGGPGCGTPPVVTLHADTADCGNIVVTASVPAGVTGTWSVPAGVHITGSTNTEMEATADAAGVYTITYTEHYGSGCSHKNLINVLVPYTADFRYELSCNQSAGGYNVTLYDHSTQFPLTPITARTYYRTPSTVIGTGAGPVTVFQPGGTTRHYYIVVGNSHGMCSSDTVAITTPAFPSAHISLDTASPNPGCVNDVVFNFHRTVGGSGLSYHWDFDDGSFNASSSNPIGKVYSDPSNPFYNVNLTVTDEYGCTAMSNTINVNVKVNPYSGHITAAPNPVCQGSPVTLQYSLTSPSTQYPTSYTWYREDAPLYTTGGPTYQVYTSGGYWVLGTGDYGCKVTSNMQAVNVIEVPSVAISGNTHQCVGQSFSLHTQDYGSGYTYSWSGAAAGSGTSLTQNISSPGTYTYYVTITDNTTGCSRTSPAFTVTVSTPPSPPSLSYSVLSCNPYELQLNASGAPGTYNWSNGMAGPTITTPFGGPYQVTLTATNGCVVQNSFVTPKSPAEYLWVFPSGCFCGEYSNPYLIGPIMPFNWAWLEDGGVVANGYGYMPNYSPLHPGSVYNMTLDNGWCSVTSDDMYYLSDTCKKLAGKPAAGNSRGAFSMSNRLLDDGGDYNALLIAPNPAAGKTTVTYRFAKGSSRRSIALMDMTGRRLQTYRLSKDRGRIELNLEGYAAGMYQIVMRRDRQVVKQGKLSVTH